MINTAFWVGDNETMTISLHLSHSQILPDFVRLNFFQKQISSYFHLSSNLTPIPMRLQSTHRR